MPEASTPAFPSPKWGLLAALGLAFTYTLLMLCINSVRVPESYADILRTQALVGGINTFWVALVVLWQTQRHRRNPAPAKPLVLLVAFVALAIVLRFSWDGILIFMKYTGLVYGWQYFELLNQFFGQPWLLLSTVLAAVFAVQWAGQAESPAQGNAEPNLLMQAATICLGFLNVQSMSGKAAEFWGNLIPDYFGPSTPIATHLVLLLVLLIGALAVIACGPEKLKTAQGWVLWGVGVALGILAFLAIPVVTLLILLSY